MSTIDPAELKLLAAMAFGESSAKYNDFEEMAAIASVLLRQRDARGFASMQDFTKKVPTYSFVVKDGNERYAVVMGLDEGKVSEALAKSNEKLIEIRNSINSLNSEIALEKDDKKLKAKNIELEKLKKTENSQVKKIKNETAHATAFAAARHALEGGEDYSEGAYFWDGGDIKQFYSTHFKVRKGIKITKPEHNIYGIEDSTQLVIIKKAVVQKNSAGKRVRTIVEVGRYDHVYESTAAHGGTIFWKQNEEYMKLTGAKAHL